MNLFKLLSSPKRTLFTVALLLSGHYMYAQPAYCSSGLGGTTGDAEIVYVTIPGTTLNNTSNGMFPYIAFPISGSTTCHIQQGGTYTITVRDSFYTGNIAMWLDFNQDGVFNTYEWFSIGTNIAGTASLTFTVPINAHTGITGLRIRSRDPSDGYVLGGDACVNYYSGQTQDYFLTIDTTLPCTGTPAAGFISGPASGCPGTAFTLGLSGYTVASGLTYQWLSHPASGGTYIPITGATTSTYTDNVSATTDYELKITCTSSGLSSTSATFTESLTPAYRCYCNDSNTLGGYVYYSHIDSVSIAGTTLNNYTPSNPHIYSAYPATGSTTATLQQGMTYTMVADANSNFGDASNISMWIDYDHSGTFDPSEWTSVGTYLYTNGVVSFTVPATATTGLTGMRIRAVDPYYDLMGSGDACSDFTTGETEDYIITIDTTYPCAGTPVAGTISGPDSVCSSQLFTLTASGYSLATGITFQWMYRPGGTGAYTALAGATGNTCMIYAQTVPTDYELIVTCTTSSVSVTSPRFTVYELPFSRCYCDSATLGGYSGYAPIDSVGIAGTTLNNYTPYNPNTYSVYPATGSTTATLQQGGYYTIAVNAYDGFDAANIALWIDYDHSGTYDASEWTSVGTNIMGTSRVLFTVPHTALTGRTGMRIRTIAPGEAGEYMGPSDACTNYVTGETEDYFITIDTTYPCTGTPTAGTISGPGSICNSIPFNLSLTGYSTAAAVTFQWQSRPAGSGSFNAIAGANTPYYSTSGITTSTDYDVVVTCTGSGLSATSVTSTVNLNSFSNCYCTPVVSYQGENEMMRAKIAGTTFDASSIYVSTTGYVQIPPTLTSNTATLRIGNSYSFTITIDSMIYNPYSAGAWIDYNQNGLYDSYEYTPLSPVYSGGYNGTFIGNLTIPAGSLPGQTGMRIATSDYVIITPNMPCGDFEVGEVADFKVSIDTAITGVAPLGDPGFTVIAFPNPANKMVTIQTYGTPGNNKNLVLTDITGRIIEKVSMDANHTELNVSNLDAGIYLVRYEDDMHTSVIKVSKQ